MLSIPPFTWEAFCDNTDIIGTIKGYGMDVEKFWFVLLFIYDMTIDHTTNVADRSKNYYELLIETRDYIDEHPNAYIYISDDRELRKRIVWKYPLLGCCIQSANVWTRKSRG